LRQGAIYDATGCECLVASVRFAVLWWERASGLLAMPRLKRGEGLLIDSCRAVHTIGMRYPIDIIFVDSEWSIVRVVNQLPTFRFRAARAACRTLEMLSGEATRLGFSAGQRLMWKDAPQ